MFTPHNLLATGLHAIDLAVVFVYMAAILVAGWLFSRGQSKSQDYFVASRSIPWMAVGLSIIATMLSTLSYLASPGEMIQHGPALALSFLALPITFFITNRLWIPMFMNLNVTSIYEYLEPRFGLTTRWVAASLFIFILRLLWMAIIVLTASEAVAQITHEIAESSLPWHPNLHEWTTQVLWSVGILATIYTMLGGIKAVIWTDVAQFIALFLGVVLTIFFVAYHTGTGPTDWWNTLTTESDTQGGFPEWFSFDITNRNVIFFTICHGIAWQTCTFVADQVAVQRYLTTKDVKAAQRGNIVNYVGDVALLILLSLCGMALLSYYLDPQFATEIIDGVSNPRDPAVSDKVFPHFIEHGLPIGVSGLVIAALFAVAMSSLDSGLNSISAVVTVDFAKRLKPDLTERSALTLAKGVTLFIGMTCTIFAYEMFLAPNRDNILGYTARTFNLALGPLGTMYIAGLFLPRVGQKAILIGTAVSLMTSTYTAWSVEINWMLGLSEQPTYELALELDKGPSIFLITPFAVVGGVFSAFVASFIFPNRKKAETREYLWKAICNRKTEHAE